MTGKLTEAQRRYLKMAPDNPPGIYPASGAITSMWRKLKRAGLLEERPSGFSNGTFYKSPAGLSALKGERE